MRTPNLRLLTDKTDLGHTRLDKSLFIVFTPPRRSSFCRQVVIPIVPCSHST